MGNRASTQTSSTDEVPELAAKLPWRQLDCEKDELLRVVKDFAPSTDCLRIALYGPTGAGKSAFVNSVQRVLLGRNAMSALENSTLAGTTFTKKMKIHKLKKDKDEHYPFEIVDIMGVQSPEGGIKSEDIIKAIEGHISDGYIFNPLASIVESNEKYIKTPSLSDKVHCLVCVLPADSVSIMEDNVFDKMREVRQCASLKDIPQVIVMTKVDKACPMVNQELNAIYQSKKIKDKVDECSKIMGIPLNAIYPVKNYSDTITQDAGFDKFLLTALKDILHFANDYVECEMEKMKSSSEN